MNILVAEDVAVNAILLRNILERGGHRVLLAENGVEALELLEQHPETDLVATDIAMPEMDGFALVREIRSRPETRELPVLFITGMADASTVHAAMEFRPAGYILKPIVEPSRVLARVESILSDSPAVLQLEAEVRARLGIDGPTYRSLLGALGCLVRTVREADGGVEEGVRRRLLDSADQVGAERLVRLMESQAGNPLEAKVLLRELAALSAELEERGIEPA